MFPTTTPSTEPDVLRRVVLAKGRHRHVVRYESGSEPLVLEAIAEMVVDPSLDFDWFDAACLAHQVGQGIARELSEAVSDAGAGQTLHVPVQ